MIGQRRRHSGSTKLQLRTFESGLRCQQGRTLKNCRTRKRGEAVRPSLIYNRWTQFVEMLKKKWVSSSDGIVTALTEEEMEIRRAELRNQIAALSQRD
jgi:hypothetical protein